ncbi:hypothetical protein ACFL3S_04540 [Gemmatimonadota bacterium]
MNVSLVPEAGRDVRWARYALALVISAHAVLLLLMLRDYFADNDLGYHISLARQYAENGFYWWDSLNWAPTGRPNLQGPALHYAIAILGRALGGDGWDYVYAFSFLAVVQWAAAVFTAVFFARRFGGDLAALLAGALFTGNIFSAASFFVGVPSGWIFILSAWAIHFFLQERYFTAVLFGVLTTFVHLGGAPVIGLGLTLAGVLTRRWRGLLLTGGLILVLTSPYTIHFLRHLDWYNGQRGHVAGSVALFTYCLAAPGVLWLLWQRGRGLFLLLWAVAPLAWLFQDGLRFFLQSSVAASAIAGMFVAWLLIRFTSGWVRPALATCLVLLATLYPFAIPSLAVEAAWAGGRGFPRELDWTEAEALARAVEEAGLQDRVFDPYYDSMCGAMSVFVPVSQQGGHWGEVRPPTDPADTISTGTRVFMLPLPPDDTFLTELEGLGLVRSHGGGQTTSIVTLPAPGNPDDVRLLAAETIRREVGWLVDHGVPNVFPEPSILFDPEAMQAWRADMVVQKARAGRIQLAVLLYAYAVEAEHPQIAAGVRRSAGGWGSVANFIGDETALDYVDEARFERFRENLRVFATEAQILRTQLLPSEDLDDATDRLFDEFF